VTPEGARSAVHDPVRPAGLHQGGQGVPAGATGTEGAAVTSWRSCPRAGCAGAIDEDGFCDTCGLEAPAPVTTSTGPVTGALTSWSSPSTGSSPSRPSRGSGRSSRGLLGRGIVDVPAVPRRDPREAVLRDPEVPEDRPVR